MTAGIDADGRVLGSRHLRGHCRRSRRVSALQFRDPLLRQPGVEGMAAAVVCMERFEVRKVRRTLDVVPRQRCIVRVRLTLRRRRPRTAGGRTYAEPEQSLVYLFPLRDEGNGIDVEGKR